LAPEEFTKRRSTRSGDGEAINAGEDKWSKWIGVEELRRRSMVCS
jgi:hypothetical protein